ncbi:hypothetical protein K3495_g16138, partial [Podosphaera aphanis]
MNPQEPQSAAFPTASPTTQDIPHQASPITNSTHQHTTTMPVDAGAPTWNEWGGYTHSYTPIVSIPSTYPDPALSGETANTTMTYAKVLGKAPAQPMANKNVVPPIRTTPQIPKPSQDSKVVTLVITKGSPVPVHQPNLIRDKINKAMGKAA